MPAENSIHPLHARVRYKITVSDAEDGESVYSEILENEVFLEVMYTANSSNAGESFPKKNSHAELALDLMRKNNCFNCHALRNPFIGPSYESVAKKYQQEKPDPKTISRRIIHGSKGLWGEQVMPPAPGITEAEAGVMVRWIEENSIRDNYQILIGLEGSFTIEPPATLRSGKAILRASYLDHGSGDELKDRQKGADIRTIQYE